MCQWQVDCLGLTWTLDPGVKHQDDESTIEAGGLFGVNLGPGSPDQVVG